MRRFGAITYRWVNGFDIVPTLPPELPGMEPFKQLPADSTLWRTLNGDCLKASGTLLLDCPPGFDTKRKGKEERCSYNLGDHRLAKALSTLGSCVASLAEASGDKACTPRIVEAILRGTNARR